MLAKRKQKKRQRIDTMIDFHVNEARKARRLAELVKKLTQSERMVDEQMLAILEWASDNPKRWHSIGNMEATQKAVELLAKRGVIEVWPETNMYRLKAPRTT
jgi:hypothetical protein